MMDDGERLKGIETQPSSTIVKQPVSVSDVTVRNLRDTPEDAEFAARRFVEGFEGKFVRNITERKLPTAISNRTAFHRGQSPSFYNRVFIAELSGQPVGLLQLQFEGDKEIEKDDHVSELGCWHACRYSTLISYMASEEVKNSKCYLSHICVDANARGKGIGKILMQRAEHEAKAKQCTAIYLYVMTNNPAINLYEREGYSVTDSHSCCLGCVFGPPGRLFKMEKTLSLG